MVRVEDLEKIYLMKDMPRDLLLKVASEAQLNIYSAGTVLFRINESIESFYMVLMGQVALQVELMPELTVILTSVNSGYAFGVSSLVSGARASSTAVCKETSELISLPVDQLTMMFEEDKRLGFEFMHRLAKLFQQIMANRTGMIMRALDKHPEAMERMGDLEHLAPVL